MRKSDHVILSTPKFVKSIHSVLFTSHFKNNNNN